jgi:ketosteroid isomerase-like protein
MRITASLSSVTLLVMVGCSPQPEVDLEAARNALISADRAWFEAYSVSESPPDAFVDGLVDNAQLLPPDAPLAQGKEAIRAVIAELEAMPGFSVTWSPASAEVADGGDLGYTIGTYEIKMEGPDGPISIDGKYLTIWKIQADGTWRVTADMFNADGPPNPQM